MEVKYTKQAEIDIFFWVKSGNKSMLKRIDLLIDSIIESPFTGIGKPEPLKYQLTGKWSRRINSEHRLVYEILNEEIVIFSAKGHYD